MWGAIYRSFVYFLKEDESGQAVTEYILLLSVLVVGVSAMTRGILAALDRGILHLGAQLERDLRTGRMRVDLWKN